MSADITPEMIAREYANRLALPGHSDGMLEWIVSILLEFHAKLTQLSAKPAGSYIEIPAERLWEGEPLIVGVKPAGDKGGEDEVKSLKIALDAATRQVSFIEDFLWGRQWCTELYISPLGTNGGEAWQVELNWGDGTQAFQGDSVAAALAEAMVAAMKRKREKEKAS